MSAACVVPAAIRYDSRQVELMLRIALVYDSDLAAKIDACNYVLGQDIDFVLNYFNLQPDGCGGFIWLSH
jgi:hypothetical protein